MASVVSSPTIEMVSRAGIMAVKVNTHAGPVSRTLEEVLARVRNVDAPSEVINRAEAVFLRIADAEKSVHGEMTHFHEVGADDAIADVLGSCMAMYTLLVDRVEILPVVTGYGTISMAHGTYPVPAPATVAILSKSTLSVTLGGGSGELLTPTGAALLAEFCSEPVTSISSGRIEAIGYGAGTKEDPHAPNVLRMFLITSIDELNSDRVDILETNVDDVSGEVIGFLVSRIMKAGARDVSILPLLMKKGRPGHLVRVICRPEDSMGVAALMAEELGTLGVRCIPSVHRFIADRRVEDISVLIHGREGLFPVKFAMMGDSCYTLKAEYESVCRFAEENNLSIRQVMREVEEAAWEKVHQKQGFRR
jgi:hypothetical protein